MSRKESKIEQQLNKRLKAGNLRSLNISQKALIDFCSNDYLGLAQSANLKNIILKNYSEFATKNGSTGSRLLTGNSALALNVEDFLASIFGVERCLVFNSGYMANLGFFSALPQRGDTLLYDELSHASIKDGCRLSMAKSLPFKHNNLTDLKRKMLQAEGELYIVCESVYSMDGDMAPLQELCALAKEHGAKLVVDEAHSTGIFGKNGAGLVAELGLQNEVFACILTFGKAMGIHGACIASNTNVIDYLINFSRPFIYTTAPSDFELISIREAFLFLQSKPDLALALQENITAFTEAFYDNNTAKSFSPSPIQKVMVSGNENTKRAAQHIQQMGFDVRPILSPTVREGEERLRICLHAFNSIIDVKSLAQELKTLVS